MIKHNRFYAFEMPDNWQGIVRVRTRGSCTSFYLIDEDKDGLIAALKLLKRKPAAESELIGKLTMADGTVRNLYAVYGTEGACSEDNADLHWRLVDRMYNVYVSIKPNEGYQWERMI